MRRFDRWPGWWALAFLLTACGGGGGGGGGAAPEGTTPPPGEQPFGLTSRPPAPALNLPIEPQPGSGDLQLIEAANGFTSPVFFTSVPGGGGRHAVVEQRGTIQLLNADLTRQGTLLDLSAQVLFSGEQGLLGLAFDPAVASNGLFYVHYNSTQGGSGRCTQSSRCSLISRFQLNSDGAGGFAFTPVSPAGEQILLEVAQPFENHKGGMIVFGPDNYLYIGLGDGGSTGDPQGNAQNRANLLGKVLRIDVRTSGAYVVPPDNPFVGNASGWRPEIWAFGLRNPWRFSFDRQTGELWLGDVGERNWEEIDRITRGGNYGWNIREGTHPFSGAAAPSDLIDPVVEYDHSLGFSVTGGYVYRGASMPGLRGFYIYGDYGSGNIWAFNPGTGANALVNASGASISSFGEDAAGELLVVDYGGRLLRMAQGGGGTTGGPPALLSATGVFSDPAALRAAPGLIEYDVNTPFWSDGAVKRRWLALPAGGQIVFSPDAAWQLPVGSAVIKHFAIALDQRDPARLHFLETRILLHERGGWAGYTYRWNDAQTDAQLLTAGASETLTVIDANGVARTQQYDYPSSAQCRSCHTDAAGFLLGLRTAQLNRNFDYVDSRGTVTDNQLRSFNHVNLFTAPIGAPAEYAVSTAIDDTAVSAERRARDYLQTNCAHCHQPGGTAPGALDLRGAIAPAAMQAIDVAPTAGDLGLADARIIAPGSKERSVLWERMRRTDANRMPPLSSHVVDQTAVRVIGEWIDSL